jgi:hypothetical protein
VRRGGRRPGAGRKAGIPTRPIRIPEPLLLEIRQFAGVKKGDIPSLRRALNTVISEGLKSAQQKKHINDDVLPVSKDSLESVVSKWEIRIQGNKKLRELFFDFKALFKKE